DVDIHSRHTALFGGLPHRSNAYLHSFIPFSLQEPVLAEISIYMASCFLITTGKLDRSGFIQAKCRALQQLNEMLASKVYATSDTAVVAVAKMIFADLCYGEVEYTSMHLRGLREMIRIRGGLSSLGMGGVITQMVVVGDFTAALTCEIPLLLEHLDISAEDDGKEEDQPHISSSHVTPFLAATACPFPMPQTPGADATTASLLDDMRFLLDTVLALPPNPTPRQLHKLNSTLDWIYSRITTASQDATHGTPDDAADTPAETPSEIYTNPIEHAIPNAETVSAPTRVQSPRSGRAISKETESPLCRVVKLTGQLYCRAIRERRPFSAVCGEEDVTEILERVSCVPPETWKGCLGVLLWVLVAILPTSRHMPGAFAGKNMAMVLGLQMSLANRKTTERSLRRALQLQEWLLSNTTERAPSHST
ncbi:hypothetical protein GQ53DRAFT_648249, partial [Thozetella sp. PMI_491]